MFGHWNLEFGIYLLFGAWDLRFICHLVLVICYFRFIPVRRVRGKIDEGN